MHNLLLPFYGLLVESEKQNHTGLYNRHKIGNSSANFFFLEVNKRKWVVILSLLLSKTIFVFWIRVVVFFFKYFFAWKFKIKWVVVFFQDLFAWKASDSSYFFSRVKSLSCCNKSNCISLFVGNGPTKNQTILGFIIQDDYLVLRAYPKPKTFLDSYIYVQKIRFERWTSQRDGKRF